MQPALHLASQPQTVIEIQVYEIVGIHQPPESIGGRPWQFVGPPDELLQLVLDVVVELEAVLIENLQTVVAGRVVRGRNHDPGSKMARSGDVGQGRGRHHADGVNVHSEAGGAGHDRGYEHVARAAGVLTDDDAAALPGQAMRRGAAERIRESRLEVDVGYATDSIRAEQSGQDRAPRAKVMGMVPAKAGRSQ